MIAMMSLQDVGPESFEELWDTPGGKILADAAV
jgi:hypothetical protein